MKVQIRDLAAFRGLHPLDIIAYLRSTGWREVETRAEHSSVWTFRVRGEHVETFVPLDRSFRDFELRLAEVVPTIATVEDRSQLEVLADLQEASSDVIRIRLQQADASDGTVSLERGVPLIENAREMLLAAACAAVEPRPHFATRKPDAAIDFIRNIRLGQTERGSFVVRILSRVAPALEAKADLFGDVEEPFERRATLSLRRALRALRTAADQAMTSRKFDSFAEVVREGVSSNLCDALVNMAGPVQSSDQLAISWTWARTRPVEPEPNREVTFPSDRFSIIAEAARHYKASAPLETFEVRGTVVKLQREEKPGKLTGPVTILGFVDGEPRKIIVKLADADHVAAVEAYKTRATVCCFGDLVKQSNQFTLQNPRGFSIIPED